MFKADNWNDYEVLAADSGEKLERWGKYILVRPDPQIIWNTERTESEWKQKNAHYHRSKAGGGEWEFIKLPREWSIKYRIDGKDLTFKLKPFSFKHTGLFPEQAVNWEWFYNIIKNEKEKTGREIRVLNMFAYTGGATLSAALAGASVVHVDASKGMVLWARENAEISGLKNKPIRWLVDDCRKFVEREIRRGNTYDGIIMDPPSYGRGPGGEIWKLEDNIFSLIEESSRLLNKESLFFLLNSYTTGLQSSVMEYMLNLSITKKFGGRVTGDEIGLPVGNTGLYLPCGSSARWEKSN